MGILSVARRVAALALLLVPTGAAALETDQFWAWRRPLEDGADAVNAWMRGEIAATVAEANRRGATSDCEQVAERIRRRLYFFIFQEIELWATHAPELDRIPDGYEESLEYRRSYLFRTDNPFDLASWMPPSPTIEIEGVRFGTDKLSHFASMGWFYYRRYRDGLRRGMDPDAAAARAIRFGVLSERTIFGASSTGALSTADLEANYRGMRFYDGLCNGERPMLVRDAEGFTLAREFDIRDHVTPEWDESWSPSIYRKRRWGRVREVLLGYCPDLHDPLVRARRAEYRARDRVTPTERVLADLVREGRIEDPATFDIERVCSGEAP